MANKIALGQIDAGIAGGTDTTSRRARSRSATELRRSLMKVNAARDTVGKVKALGAIRPGDIGLEIPRNGEPRTGLSMGEHAALTALRVAGHPRGAGRAGGRVATSTSPRRTTPGGFDDLVTPFRGVEPRPEPAAGLDRREKLGDAEAGLRAWCERRR